MTLSEAKWGDAVRLDIEHHIAQATLNRPDADDGFDPDMQMGSADCVRGLPDRQDVRAIVFAANGRIFPAGGHFGAILADNVDPVRRRPTMRHGRLLFTSLADCPLQTVTALQCNVVGPDATLILCTDAIVAARCARPMPRPGGRVPMRTPTFSTRSTPMSVESVRFRQGTRPTMIQHRK